jgi:methyl-accepting chemotaxis protein
MIGEIDGTAATIAAAVEEQGAATGEIGRNADEVRQAVQALADQAKALESGVNTFLEKMRA